MQPYFLPYIGYFQLMHAVDCFVLFDDVQYIERGWINRNLIRLEDRAVWLTMPVQKASRSLPINKRFYQLNDQSRKNPRNLIHSCYSKAPQYSEVIIRLGATFETQENNVARFNGAMLSLIANMLGIRCSILYASEIASLESLRGPDRILELCRRLGASEYINAIGGLSLYEPEPFHVAGMALQFIRTRIPPKSLSTGSTHLSVVDSLMCDGWEKTRSLLDSYEIVSPHSA